MAIGSASENNVYRPKFLTASLLNLDDAWEFKQPTAKRRPTFAAPSTEFEDVQPTREPEIREHDQPNVEPQVTEQRQLLEGLRNRTLDLAVSNERNQLLEDHINAEYKEFVAGIYLSIVRNWVRPPSARNNMEVGVLVELFPNGDLISVGVVESSGNSAFDRSAVAAVKKAAPFRVPDDSIAFETGFRTIKLKFKPQDLLR